MIIFNLMKMVIKQGPKIKIRNQRRARNTLLMQNAFTSDKVEEEASDFLCNFSQSYETTLLFENKIRSFPAQIDYWGYKALKVIKMRRDRREFLSEIFQRELEIMTNFYKGKKKAGKKTLLKLMAIKPHNLEKILDDFFFKICRAFFKR